MPVTGARLRYREFLGAFNRFAGVNYVDPPDLMPDTQVQQADNFFVGTYGNMRKRPGVLPVDTLPVNVTSSLRMLGQFIKSDGTNQVIAFSASDAHVYYRSNSTTPVIDMGTCGGSEVVMGVQYQDTYYMVTVSSGVWKWNGTTLAAVATSPNGYWITTFKDRLWVCGTNSQLIYSSPGPSQETWPPANVIRVNGGDGDRLVAAVPFNDRIVCFKSRSIWNLYLGPDPAGWQVRLFVMNRGVLSPFGVKVSNGVIYFIDYAGIYKTDGASLQLLSDPIRTIFYRRKLVVLSDFYKSDSLSFFDKYIFCSMQTDTTTFRYMVYNQASNGWTEWKFDINFPFQPTEIFQMIDNQGAIHWLFSHLSTEAHMYMKLDDVNLSTTRQDGQGQYPVVCTLVTKRSDFNFQYRWKRNKVTYLELGGQTVPSYLYAGLQVFYAPDTGNPVQIVFANRYPVGQTEASYRIPGCGYFRELTITIQESTKAYFEIKSINVPFTIKTVQDAQVQ